MSDGTQQDGGDSGDSGDIGALERDGSGARGGGLLAAIIFLTRVPLRLRARPDMAKAVPWFGIVGVMLGAAIGATFVGLAELMPPLPAAAAAVLAGILVTGAFHEDGLADVADAFAAVGPPPTGCVSSKTPATAHTGWLPWPARSSSASPP